MQTDAAPQPTGKLPPPPELPPQGELGGHPKALYVLSSTEMWERFNYYGMRAILILYMTKAVAEGGLGWSQSKSSIIYGWFTGLVYLLTIFGGIIADNALGQRRSILIGGTLMALGQFTLAFGPNSASFFLGLALICIGNGLFKPNISTMVGNLYRQGDSRRDSAFTIFYLGINAGVILAAATGYLEAGPGARWGFAACGVAMLLSLVIMRGYGPRYLGPIGVEPKAKEVQREKAARGDTQSTWRFSRMEWERLFVLFVIMLYATMFWLGFELQGSALNLYTRDYIDRSILGYEVPTGVFQSVNSVYIVSFSLVFAWLWTYLAKRNREPNTPIKMGIALLLLGVGYLCMMAAAAERGGDVPDTTIKAGMHWLLLTYLFFTLGELCLSPVGLSVFTKLAPKQIASMMMGVWFVAVGLANLIGGYVSASVESAGPTAVFTSLAYGSLGLGVLALLVSPILKRMMHGVH